MSKPAIAELVRLSPEAMRTKTRFDLPECNPFSVQSAGGKLEIRSRSHFDQDRFSSESHPSGSAKVNYDFLMRVGIRFSLRHLDFQLPRPGDDPAFHGRDLAGIPDIEGVTISRASGDIERQAGLQRIPGFGDHAEPAARASERREFIGQ